MEWVYGEGGWNWWMEWGDEIGEWSGLVDGMGGLNG